MRLPFTKYGLRELAIFGAAAAVLMIAVIVLSFLFLPLVTLALFFSILAILPFVWVLSFFRDPKRIIPKGDHRIVAPADGTIYDIDEVEEPEFIGEKCLRLGIFLSIFDCHINRAPCAGVVEKIIYKKGQFHSAWTAAKDCSEHNESNFIGLSNAAGRGIKVAVKQIAGQIARRIVCDLREGDEVERGQQFGMIKFGSRTELFIPLSANFDLKLKLGAPIKAGRTVLGTLSDESEGTEGPASDEEPEPLTEKDTVPAGDDADEEGPQAAEHAEEDIFIAERADGAPADTGEEGDEE